MGAGKKQFMQRHCQLYLDDEGNRIELRNLHLYFVLHMPPLSYSGLTNHALRYVHTRGASHANAVLAVYMVRGHRTHIDHDCISNRRGGRPDHLASNITFKCTMTCRSPQRIMCLTHITF